MRVVEIIWHSRCINGESRTLFCAINGLFSYDQLFMELFSSLMNLEIAEDFNNSLYKY